MARTKKGRKTSLKTGSNKRVKKSDRAFWTGAYLTRLIERSRLYEAFLVVLGLWIIALGVDLVILAQLGILSGPVFWSDLILVSIGIFGGWLALSGAGYLLALSVGGRGDYRDVLLGLAFASWPLALLGVVVIILNFFAALLGVSATWIVALSLLLTWLGLILGVPGYGLARVLEVSLKIKEQAASLIAILLLVFTGALLIWLYGQLVDFGQLIAAGHVCHAIIG